MSVWKRLSNVAKGQVKVWQNGSSSSRDAAVEAELSELERHPAPGEARDEARDTAPRRSDSRPASPPAGVPNPAEDPVPRTDLFPDEGPPTDDDVQDAPMNGGTRKL